MVLILIVIFKAYYSTFNDTYGFVIRIENNAAAGPMYYSSTDSKEICAHIRFCTGNHAWLYVGRIPFLIVRIANNSYFVSGS